MRPTHHVRLLVLAALAGCDRGAMHVRDDADSDTPTPSAPDTDDATGTFDPPDTDLEDWDGDGTPDPADPCRGPGLVPDEDGDGICEDVDVCVGHDLTGNDDGDAWCDDVDPCDDRVVAAGTACTPPDPLPVNPCVGEPRLFDGRHTGFVTCPNGAVDRLFATSGWLFPETQTPMPAQKFWGAVDQCLVDTDCSAGPYGACTYGRHNGYEGYLSCAYGCDSDADCGPTGACVPPTAGVDGYGGRDGYQEGSAWSGRGRCVYAACHSGADCDSGRCGLTFDYWYCGVGTLMTTCRTAQDPCEVRSDCWLATRDYQSMCNPVGDAFACEARPVACGRPLRGPAGEALVADLVAHAPTHASHIAAHWVRVGLMEHASVASFARHALQLLALGAPADLVADVSRAMADEVRHAELAFGLARGHGQDAAPGPLPFIGVSWAADVDAVFADLVHEGCVGETLAAAEAAWLAARAADPHVRSVLHQIADDEARHAALAWRTVAWLIAEHPHLRDSLADHVADALGRTSTDGDAVGLTAWGAIDAAGREAVRAAVIDDVITPALGQLAALPRAA